MTLIRRWVNVNLPSGDRVYAEHCSFKQSIITFYSEPSEIGTYLIYISLYRYMYIMQFYYRQ